MGYKKQKVKRKEKREEGTPGSFLFKSGSTAQQGEAGANAGANAVRITAGCGRVSSVIKGQAKKAQTGHSLQ